MHRRRAHLRRITRSVVPALLAATAVGLAAATSPASGAEGRGAADCGLTGQFRAYSARIVYTPGGAGAMTTPPELLTLSGGHWQFGSSSGSFRVSSISAADWKRWGASPYGPTQKITFAGWAGGMADGPIETEGSRAVVDFVWAIYPVRPPLVSRPGIVELKFGHAVVPKSCGSAAPAPARAAHVTIRPVTVKAGGTISVTAGPFLPNESLSLTETYTLDGVEHTTGLMGGNADAKGMLRFEHDTLPESPPGVHELCVRGGASTRAVCGRFVVRGVATQQTSAGSSGSPAPKSSNGSAPMQPGSGFAPPKVGPGFVPPNSR